MGERKNVEHIVAIELLCAAQGIDFRGPEKLGKGTKAAYSAIREGVSMLKEDRVMLRDIETVVKLIRGGELVQALEKTLARKV